MKVAINSCFGGFNLSEKAHERLIELGWTVTTYGEDHKYVDPTADLVDSSSSSYPSFGGFSKYHGTSKYSQTEFRTHPQVIQVIEEMGKEASGSCANLRIIEIPDDIEWEITEYDGFERIEEVHRKWD